MIRLYRGFYFVIKMIDFHIKTQTNLDPNTKYKWSRLKDTASINAYISMCLQIGMNIQYNYHRGQNWCSSMGLEAVVRQAAVPSNCL